MSTRLASQVFFSPRQSSSPEYFLLVSPLGGEKRFAAALAKRLESLGALTQGDRSASIGAQIMGDFNFDNKYGAMAMQHLWQLLRNSCAKTPSGTARPTLTGPSLLPSLVADTVRTVAEQPLLKSLIGFKERPFTEQDVNLPTLTITSLYKVGINIFYKEPVSVPIFLNRLLGLGCACQNFIFAVST